MLGFYLVGYVVYGRVRPRDSRLRVSGFGGVACPGCWSVGLAGGFSWMGFAGGCRSMGFAGGCQPVGLAGLRGRPVGLTGGCRPVGFAGGCLSLVFAGWCRSVGFASECWLPGIPRRVSENSPLLLKGRKGWVPAVRCF
jgi:hypothetical protein